MSLAGRPGVPGETDIMLQYARPMVAATADVFTYAERALETNDIPVLSLPPEVGLCCLSLIELFRIP